MSSGLWKMSILIIAILASKMQVTAPKGRDEWRLDNESPIAIDGPCTIEKIDARHLSQEYFLEWVAFSRPLIIYNYQNNDGFRKLARRGHLLSEWRNMPVVLSSANTYSYSKVNTSFGHYIENIMCPQTKNILGNETLYLFGDIDTEIWEPLLNTYVLPPWSLPDHEPALSFGIAAVGTGVPFHFHGPGFGEVIHGSKRWFLQKFEDRPEFDPDQSSLNWFINIYPNLPENKRPLECLLNPRELIYFPDKWWHATLNAQTSVFVSTFLGPIVKRKLEP